MCVCFSHTNTHKHTQESAADRCETPVLAVNWFDLQKHDVELTPRRLLCFKMQWTERERERESLTSELNLMLHEICWRELKLKWQQNLCWVFFFTAKQEAHVCANEIRVRLSYVIRLTMILSVINRWPTCYYTNIFFYTPMMWTLKTWLVIKSDSYVIVSVSDADVVH